MTWCEQLTRRTSAPEWRGPAQVHLKLSAGDEAATVEAAPQTLPKDKACTKCKRVLPLTPDYFFRNCREKTGFMCECKACHKERDREPAQRRYHAKQTLAQRKEQRRAQCRN